jgi:hypothetical protein
LQRLPKVYFGHPVIAFLLCLSFVVYLTPFLSSSVAALATANARIASLEAEVSASQQAYDVAAAAKANAEKSQKSAHGKVKKAEKALADAKKEYAQREQAVAEHLRTMSTAAESMCSSLSSISTSVSFVVLVDIFLSFSLLSSFVCSKFTGVSSSSLQPDDDALMNVVNLLEETWISIQETFELASRILSRLFVGLWPKKKTEVPKDNLDKLAKTFDTTEDPILQLKGLSLKCGVEGAIALSFAHGADFDWEKVSSSHGCTHDEMKSFFEKAKKLVPALVAIISPLAAFATPATPPPAAEDPAPPSTVGEEFTMPSSAMEQNAEVA